MIKRVVAKVLVGVMALSSIGLVAVSADAKQPYVALGADLRDNERKTVLELLGVTEEELHNYEVATVTNAEEHEYLGSYLSAAVIGSRALSSVKLEEKGAGHGIKVTTKNISYCTTGMYQNALVTAGVKDAEVVVAGPFNISGTAALVGTIKAYNTMTGEVLKPENVEAATNELVVTSQLGESMGDQEKAEQLIGTVKDVIVGEAITDPEEIKSTIEETATKLEITLSEEEKQEIATLMSKIADLDLDIDALQEQVSGLYDKLKDLGIDLSVDSEKVEGFFASLGQWFVDTWSQIKQFFS
jgi:Predicted secreted protein